MERDHVDLILAQWASERPDLDTSPMGVIGRISRVAKIAGRSMEALFSGHGLTREGFDVLATLRRSGPPYQLSPTRLFQMLMVSSGTMTNRLDRLEEARCIVRIPDPDDRRGTLIELTDRGRELVDTAVVAHLANERAMLGALTAAEQEQLAGLLRKLLLIVEA